MSVEKVLGRVTIEKRPDEFPQKVVPGAEVRLFREQGDDLREEERLRPQRLTRSGEDRGRSSADFAGPLRRKPLLGSPLLQKAPTIVFRPLFDSDRNLGPPRPLATDDGSGARHELLLVVGRTSGGQDASSSFEVVEKIGQRTERVLVPADAQKFVEAVEDGHEDSQPRERGDRVVSQRHLQVLEFRRQRLVQAAEGASLGVDIQEQPLRPSPQIEARVMLGKPAQHGRLARSGVPGEHHDLRSRLPGLLDETTEQLHRPPAMTGAAVIGVLRVGGNEVRSRPGLQSRLRKAPKIRHLVAGEELLVGERISVPLDPEIPVGQDVEVRFPIRPPHPPGRVQTAPRISQFDEGSRIAEREEIRLETTLPPGTELERVTHGPPR